MKRTIKYSLAVVLISSSLHAGGGKDIVPQDAPVTEIPAMLTTVPSSNFYVGGGIGIDSVSSYLYGPDTAYSGVLRVGYDFNKYIGVEARGTVGLSDGDQLGHDYTYGVYLKPQYPINDTFTIYGLAGYAQTEISFENEVAFNGITNDYTTQSDFSFGAGLEYKVDNKWSVFTDLTRYIDKETTKPEGKYAIQANALTFGFVYHF